MIYSSIYQEVAANFTTTVTTRAKAWVNMAYQEFLSSSAWSFLETTGAAVPVVASQAVYTLAGTAPVVTDFAGLISVTLEVTAAGFREKLWEMDPQLFEATAARSRVNGVPVFFTIQGGAPAATPAAVVSGGQQQLVLWPIPTNVAGQGVNLYIRYIRNAASIEMSADSDVPIIPITHHAALVWGATAIGMQSYNQDGPAQGWRQNFLQRIQEAAREDIRMRNQDSQRVQAVQQPWLYPIVGGQGQNSQAAPPAPDRYPVPHQ